MRSSPCEMFKRISLLNDLEQRFIRQAFATSTPAQGANRPSLLAVQTLTPLAAIATNSGTTAGGIRMLRNHTCELALLDSFVSDEEIRARQIINQQNKLTYPQAAEKSRRPGVIHGLCARRVDWRPNIHGTAAARRSLAAAVAPKAPSPWPTTSGSSAPLRLRHRKFRRCRPGRISLRPARVGGGRAIARPRVKGVLSAACYALVRPPCRCSSPSR